MLTTEAAFRCHGRCSRAMARLLEDLLRWLGLPWWLALAILLLVAVVALALAAYIGRRRPRRRRRKPLRARRRRW